MEDQEFDNALRGVAGGSPLPYDDRQWEQMARRLEAFEAGKASAPGRTIPLYQWATAAAAACLVVLAGLYISKAPEGRVAQQGTIAVQRDPAPPMPDSEPQIPGSASAVAAQTETAKPEKTDQPAAKDRRPAHQAVRLTQAIIAGQPAGPKPADPAPVPAASPQKAVPAAAQIAPPVPAAAERPPQLASVPPALSGYPLPDEEADLSRARRTAFGVHGGYNIGQAKNNFTLGVSVRQKLSERLHLETGIAFVSGAYKTYEPVLTTITTYGGSGGGVGNLGSTQSIQTVQSYEESSNTLLYLQAAPTLNYRIYKGLTAGGGVDAQRLLGNNNSTDAVSYNSMGEETAAQPQWDFGVTARMDVQVARRIRAGMMYRESMRSISKSSRQEAASRNYLLLQLSYTLF